jgi:lipoate-protein ligase B
MIPIQIKHAVFDNTLNDECLQIIDRIGDETDQAADRYWIMTHDDQQLFTCGTDEAHYAGSMPAQINGIPVVPQSRNGGITYHGAGQLSWGWMINIRRILRLQDTRSREFNIHKLMQIWRNVLNLEFSENLITNPGDPGLYRINGEKVCSFGTQLLRMRWIVVKISINLHTNLDVYNNATICGVQNRSMGNLLPSLPDVKTQQDLGQRLLQVLWDNIYEAYEVQTWTDK